MNIGSRQIGADHPPYIIAELGVNHDGSVDRALKLTDAAAEAGADAIKLQLFKADLLMSKAAKLAAYQKAAGESDPVEMLRRLELSIDQMAPVVERAHARGVHAIVTLFSVELVDDAERLPWDAYKTASPDIVHKPLLDCLAATGKPLIVSTGASTLDEVTRALHWLSGAQDRMAVLQCVSCYPTERMELGGIGALKQVFLGPVGYSDHTKGHRTSGWAVAAGACILEKHLTYDQNAAGPDHKASLVPWMLKRYVSESEEGVLARQYYSPAPDFQTFAKALRVESDPQHRGARDLAYMARGEHVKRVLECEQDVRAVSRQSITTRRSLAAGHVLTRADVTFKRPGTGLLPFELERAVGRTLRNAIDADMPIFEHDLA